MDLGLIFDLDGVITDTAKFHYLSWKEIVKPLGIDLKEEINEQIKGFPRQETLLKILEIFNINNISEIEIEQICDAKNKLYLEFLNKNLSEKDILPNIKSLILCAKKYKVKIALASSSKNAILILKKLNIFDLFDFIVNPSNVDKPKPAPDIYLAAAKGINLKPLQCIGFEDAQIGIEGLNRAKIFSVGINEKDKYVKNHSKLFVPSTKELNWKIILGKYKSFCNK